MASHTTHSPGPWGHSAAAHRVLGWCAHCPDRSPVDEVLAWRTDAQERHALEDAPGPFVDTATEWRPCPECGHDKALSVVTVAMRGTTGRKIVGGWTYCLVCEAAPREAARV